MESFKFFSKEEGDIDRLKERPKVFSEETFGPVLKFAGRFDRLRVPVTAEEAEKYREKYGECAEIISSEDLGKVSSVAELKNLVDEKVGSVLKEELPQVLGDVDEEQKETIISAAANKEFEDIDPDDKKVMGLAVGLSLVAERSRTETMKRVLKNLNQETLEKIEMTPRQRDVVLDLLGAFPGINTEFLRFRARLEGRESFSERPVDILRERRFVAQKMRDFREKTSLSLKMDQTPIFGSSEKDEAFLQYIGALERSYAPFKENDKQSPLSLAAQQASLKEAQKAFSDLYAAYPDFPLIAFPAFSHYGADDAVKGGRKSWEAFGFDPEIRLYWQRREERNKHVPGFEAVRDKLADFTANSFSDVADVSDLRRCRVLIGEPLAASGINIKESTLGQEEKDIMLMVIEEPDNEYYEKNQAIFETYLENPDDLEIIRNKAFYGLVEHATLAHEFAHKIYPENGLAADNLEKHDDDLCEYKSELAMWVAGGSILKEEAQKSFGDKAIRAIQLAMAREALRQYRVNNQTGEDRPYHIAEREILKTFLENNILIERDGKLRLSTERFDEDLGRLFEDQFRQALSIYRRASTGNKQDLRVAKQEAGVLIGQKVPTALKIVKKQK